MDPSIPVSRRTRQSEAVYFKKLHDEIKKKRKKNWDYDEGFDLDGNYVHHDDDDGVRESVVNGGDGVGGCSVKRKGKGKKKMKRGVSVADSGVEKGGGVIACSEEGENGVECLGFGVLGSNDRFRMKGFVEKSRNVNPIAVVISSDDDEAEAIGGERGDEGVSCVNSSFSCVKTGDGLKEVGAGDVESENEISASPSLKGKDGKRSRVGPVNDEMRLDEPESVEVHEISDSDDAEKMESSSPDELDDLDESSEEDNDDEDDEDYDIEDVRSQLMLSASEESEVEEAVYDSSMSKSRGSNTEKAEVEEVTAKEVNFPIKRRNSCYGKEKNTVEITPRAYCVARRTRASFTRTPKAETVKLGTVRNHSPPEDINGRSQAKQNKIKSKKRNVNRSLPEEACRDDDDGHNDIEHHYQAKNSEKKTKCKKRNMNQELAEEGLYSEEDLGKPRGRKRVRRKSDVIKILLDSILSKNDGIVEELVSSIGSTFGAETASPVTAWSFVYPEKDSIVSDNSDDDNGEMSLWKEFDFALRSSEIGSTNSFTIDDKIPVTTAAHKYDQASLCSRGRHQFIINDEVGIMCKFCSCVHLEIKYVSLSFDKQSGKTSPNTTLGKMDGYKQMDLQFPDSGYDSELECDPHYHANGTVWDKVPGIKDSLYQHQREGFEFIWKSIAGSIDLQELESINFNGGSGCIISHAPGTGKTRLILSFVQSYMKLYGACKPVIIAPASMLYTWEEQCRLWKFPFAFHNLNNKELSGQENISVLKLLGVCKYKDQSVDISKNHGSDMKRMAKIYSWIKGKSVLGISYTLFERLIRRGEVGNGDGKIRHKIQSPADRQLRQILLERPGLLVLDEGHTPRNSQSRMWKALVKIQTEKRIILSGTPFQNNFDELYTTLRLVRPKFLETASHSHWRKHFKVTHGRKSSAAKGTWASLTKGAHAIGNKASGKKLKELRDMIDPFVHVYKGTILQERLPGLRESLVVLKPHPTQKAFLDDIHGLKNTFEKYHLVSLLTAHPSLILSSPPLKEKYIDKTEELTRLRLNPEVGVKTRFVMELIRLSVALDEKVLVFSQYVQPLMLIKDQLKSLFNWNEGDEVLYMDGQRSVKERQSSINVFNEADSEAKVLLASTGACSEGINLVGASRVVLLDKVWNPSVETQAISRAYRLGQKRVVYIYHLIASGTLEGEKYIRQSEKERLSELVFSDTQNEVEKISEILSEDKILEEMAQHEKLKDIFEKIVYQPKDSNVVDPFVLFNQPRQFSPESYF